MKNIMKDIMKDIIKDMNGGDDPSVKRKLLRNIKSKYVNEKIPSKRFPMIQGKSYKTNNKRSPLKNEIVKEPEIKIEPEIKMEQGPLKNNSYNLTSLQNIKKLKKEYIRKDGNDLDFLEKLNKKVKELEKELEKELFDNLESDFIKSNFDTDQSGSGASGLTEEEKIKAQRKRQAESARNRRKGWKEDWVKSLTEEQRIDYYKYKETEDKKKNLTEEEKREARKKYQAEWVKNKRKNLNIANILLELKSGKRTGKRTGKRSGTSPVMRGSGKALTEEKREARKKYQAEWVKNKRKNLTEEQKEVQKKYKAEWNENKNKKLKIANILLELKSGKRSGTSPVMQGSGKIRSQYYGKQSKVMVKVPENVKKTALYSFKLKKLGFGGGLETGWKRAKQLATKESISIQDLRYMRAWFARHIYTSYPTYKKWAKAGRPKTKEWHSKHGIVSWLIWGADAGFKWVNSQKNINLLNKHYNKNYKSMKLPK